MLLKRSLVVEGNVEPAPLVSAREGAPNKRSPALGAGKTDVAEFRGRGGGHYKVLRQREIL
ncbi:MAG: hypothetical protein JO231_15780 [Acidobacteria bacterium]|nr:hypothetical protein [Acidobacteriota bacterium]